MDQLCNDSDANGKGIIGGSGQFGPGYGGLGVNTTFQSYETKTINLIDLSKSLNPLNMKPLKYYK